MSYSPYYWFTQHDQHQSDLRRKLIRHSWRGPTKQAYILEEGEPIILDITDPADKYKITSIPMDKVVGQATLCQDGKWTGTHPHNQENRIIWIHLAKDDQKTEDLSRMVELIRESIRHLREDEERIQASSLLQLERELKRKDWWSHMSDDHSVWLAGNQSDARIQKFIPNVSVDDFRRLWSQYAPADFACPI